MQSSSFINHFLNFCWQLFFIFAKQLLNNINGLFAFFDYTKALSHYIEESAIGQAKHVNE